MPLIECLISVVVGIVRRSKELWKRLGSEAKFRKDFNDLREDLSRRYVLVGCLCLRLMNWFECLPSSRQLRMLLRPTHNIDFKLQKECNTEILMTHEVSDAQNRQIRLARHHHTIQVCLIDCAWTSDSDGPCCECHRTIQEGSIDCLKGFQLPI